MLHTSIAHPDKMESAEAASLRRLIQEKDARLERVIQTLQHLSNSIPGGVGEIALDEGFTLIEGNEALYELYGYTPQQLKDELGNRLAAAMPGGGIASYPGSGGDGAQREERFI